VSPSKRAIAITGERPGIDPHIMPRTEPQAASSKDKGLKAMEKEYIGDLRFI
jgi:hypothetical protein